MLQTKTPADRIQLAQELMSGGIITGDAFVSILRHYDTYGEIKVSQSQRRYIQKQIDKWLFADPKDLQDPKFYKAPVRSMLMPAAVVQVNGAMLDAMSDDVPQARITFFSRFLKQCQAFITEDQSKLAGLAQQSGGTAAALQTIQSAAA